MQNDSYNRGGFIAFMFSMIFSLGFFAYLILFHPGIDLKEVKPRQAPPEQTLAGAAPAKEVDVSKVEKPWIENEDMITHGKKVYANNCTVCHGATGEGNGPAGMGLNPPPRNLVAADAKWKKGADSINIYTTLEKGLAGTSMAAFGHLPAVDRWALTQYVRSLHQGKVKDDPAKLEAFAKTAK